MAFFCSWGDNKGLLLNPFPHVQLEMDVLEAHPSCVLSVALTYRLFLCTLVSVLHQRCGARDRGLQTSVWTWCPLAQYVHSSSAPQNALTGVTRDFLCGAHSTTQRHRFDQHLLLSLAGHLSDTVRGDPKQANVLDTKSDHHLKCYCLL